MSSIRRVAQPILPLPPEAYSPIFQNVLNSNIQKFGSSTANAINQLLQEYDPQTLDYSSEFTFDSGVNATYRVRLLGDIKINPPQTASDGDIVNLWLYSGSIFRIVTLNSAIAIPTTITGATPITVGAGKKAVYTFRYDSMLQNGKWELVSFQNGY